MIEIVGSHNYARIFTHQIDQASISQIYELCCRPEYKDSRIRLMPDVHAGAGCTIGTTMTLDGKVSPSLVGVDIGCGMLTMNIGKGPIDFARLDEFIHQQIPHGFDVREKPHIFARNIQIEGLICKDHVDLDRGYRSIGTLGSGNHFIEVDTDEEGNNYLVIHSGSRNLGQQVALYWQKVAYEDNGSIGNKDLAYLSGEHFDSYINDMKIMQNFAKWNREAMADDILSYMGWKRLDAFETIHNYIDIQNMILRKGAVSAQLNERLLIPINMRDGSLLCVGKGNPDWNWSAPHGAGRLMSRSEAKASLDLDEFAEQMSGIYTTCVKQSTLDESPMAYKSMQDIIDNIKEIVEIEAILRPIYNFKA